MKPKVHDKSTLLKLLVENSDQIRAYGVKKIGLFGSFVRDKDIRINSDVDLLVDFHDGKKTFDNFMDLNFYLEDITGRKVQILTRAGLSKHIGPYILKEVQDVKLQGGRRIIKRSTRRT